MTDPVQFASDIFFRHEPVLVRFVTPDISRLIESIQSRSVRKDEMIIEILPSLQSVSLLTEGSEVEVRLRLPDAGDFLQVRGRLPVRFVWPRIPRGVFSPWWGLSSRIFRRKLNVGW